MPLACLWCLVLNSQEEIDSVLLAFCEMRCSGGGIYISQMTSVMPVCTPVNCPSVRSSGFLSLVSGDWATATVDPSGPLS